MYPADFILDSLKLLTVTGQGSPHWHLYIVFFADENTSEYFPVHGFYDPKKTPELGKQKP